jgi:hypothetical protein
VNLARVLAHGAAEHPERPALLFEGDRIRVMRRFEPAPAV